MHNLSYNRRPSLLLVGRRMASGEPTDAQWVSCVRRARACVRAYDVLGLAGPGTNRGVPRQWLLLLRFRLAVASVSVAAFPVAAIPVAAVPVAAAVCTAASPRGGSSHLAVG